MHFDRRIKGAITESLVKTLLEDSDYRVIPLGIEEVVREVISLDEDEYRSLEL